MQQELNVFSGESAVRDFLNPDNNPMLPLIELPKHLNPFVERKVRIFAKLMNFLPLANVKSLPALNMLMTNEREGKRHNVESMIENSSGNTVFSLAVIGRVFGIKETKAIVSHEVSPGKLQLLRFFDTKVSVNEEPICPDPRDKTSGIYQAREIGKQQGMWNPGQYDNTANPEAHERWTGPQIWKQTAGKITLFCAGLGTTGTMVGAGRYLKIQNHDIFNLGVVREPNNPVPGVRTNNLLQEIAFDWRGTVNETVEVGTVESFERSLALCRNGILVGPSSGFALAGLLDFLSSAGEEQLKALRNDEGEILAVFICPDSPFPYIEEYFECLDPKLFPEIENANLLQHHATSPINQPRSVNLDVSPREAFGQIYDCKITEAWRLVNLNKSVPVKRGVQIIDARNREEFDHVHLPQSEHVEYRDLLTKMEEISRGWQNEMVYVICNQGNRSNLVANTLKQNGVEACSIAGGLIEWSRQNLPRWRPEACIAFGENHLPT